MDSGAYVLGGVHIGATWRKKNKPSTCGGDAAFLSNYFEHLLSSPSSFTVARHVRRQSTTNVSSMYKTRQYQTPDFAPVLPSGESLCVYALLASPLPGRLWTNMTSSAKPEVHNVLHCRQRRTEPRTQLIGIQQISWSLGVCFFIYASEQTDRQTCASLGHLTSTL